MSIVDNLMLISSYKSDIKSAIEDKGVDMTGVPFSSYAEKIGEIQGGGVTGYTIDDIVDTDKISGTVSGSITSTIRSGAFWGISTFYRVSFPNATGIGRYAFAQTKVGNVTFPNVVNVYDFAFQSCELTSASFPELINIGGSAFNSCLYLKSIYAPNLKSVTTCGFSTCIALSYIDFPVISSIGLYAFYSCHQLSNVNIPQTTYIGQSAFYSCIRLQSVSLPIVSSFGNTVFNGCSALSEVTVGTDLYYVPTLGTNAFSNTPMVKSTYLGHYGSIYVPISLVDSYKATSNWSVVKDRIVGVGDPNDVVLKFANNSLYGRYSLSLSASDMSRLKITSTSDLYHIDLPNIPYMLSVSNYTKLKTVSIPNVLSIDNNTFSRCSSLESLYVGLNLSEVCKLGTNALSWTPMVDSTYLGYYGSIYVPMSLVDAYKKATNWVAVKDRIVGI